MAFHGRGGRDVKGQPEEDRHRESKRPRDRGQFHDGRLTPLLDPSQARREEASVLPQYGP